jgi:hypothetical protein
MMFVAWPVWRALDVARAAPDRVGPDDRGDERDAADDQRVHRHGADLLERQHAEQHHGDGGDRVCLEQVRCHARAVADVVAHVVGDHRRVAGIVLRDARLDLADEVGSHVGGLREDAAAEAGEDGDQRAAEAEADQRVDRVALVGARHDQDPVVAGHTEQRQARYQKAGDGPALERHLERPRHPAAG